MSALRRRIMSSSLLLGALLILVPALSLIEIYFVWVRPCASTSALDHCTPNTPGLYHKLAPIAPSFIFAIVSIAATLTLTLVHFAARLLPTYGAAAFPQLLVRFILCFHFISAACLMQLTDAARRVAYLSNPFAAVVLCIEFVYFLYFVGIAFLGLYECSWVV